MQPGPFAQACECLPSISLICSDALELWQVGISETVASPGWNESRVIIPTLSEVCVFTLIFLFFWSAFQLISYEACRHCCWSASKAHVGVSPCGFHNVFCSSTFPSGICSLFISLQCRNQLVKVGNIQTLACNLNSAAPQLEHLKPPHCSPGDTSPEETWCEAGSPHGEPTAPLCTSPAAPTFARSARRRVSFLSKWRLWTQKLIFKIWLTDWALFICGDNNSAMLL